jgi:hypothetical protein
MHFRVKTIARVMCATFRRSGKVLCPKVALLELTQCTYTSGCGEMIVGRSRFRYSKKLGGTPKFLSSALI